MESLSVVIVTRNRPQKLERCLVSVKQHLPESEVIVVDNGSQPSIEATLKKYRGIISLLLRKNVGVARARNLGVKQSSGDWIIFIDDDAWIQKLNMNEILDYMNKNDFVGIIAPKILYPDGRIQESVRSFPTLRALIWRGLNLYKIFPTVSWYKKYVQNDISRIHKVDWAIGACLIIPRKTFNQVGLFENDYFFGYEDADFCRQATKKGYSTIFWPDAEIYHDYERKSANGISIDLFRHISSIIRFFYGDSKTFK